jgi:gluconate 2-dehydrogenase gamma chain
MDGGKLAANGAQAAAFFALLLRNTREGYFADPQYGGNREMGAWKAIGFPGARADFTDWIDQQGKPYPYGPVAISGARG